MVGTTGFEPATSWPQTKRSTRLSYVPMEPQVGIEPTKGFHPFQFTKLGP